MVAGSATLLGIIKSTNNRNLRKERPPEAIEKDVSETHIPVVEERLDYKGSSRTSNNSKRTNKRDKNDRGSSHEDLVIERKTVEDY